MNNEKDKLVTITRDEYDKLLRRNETEINITKKEYKELLHRSFWLQCLENAGVDNWGGIDLAREEYSLFITDEQ